MDTIAAIATAAGGGVGIVRISGPASEAIVRQLVPTLPKTLASHKLYLGEAIHPRLKDALDQVLVVLMRAPRSYTGDDVAELHGHGGHATLNALLGAVLGVGARLATPGEFTRRAFLAGKIDLSQAEAVSVLIGARDERTARAAQALRRGAMGKLIDEARGIIVAELAEIEGALDFPDEVDSIEAPALRATRLQKLSASLRERVGSYSRPVGMVPDVLLVGRVNAGKSSLLNAMVGRERALVDEEPGTTRDAIEAELELPDGTLIRVVDTAGERAQASGLEQRGRAIARARWGEASLVLCVFDRSLGWSHLDEDLRAELAAAELPMLFVENKADLPAARE